MLESAGGGEMTKRTAEQDLMAMKQFIRDRAFEVDALLHVLEKKHIVTKEEVLTEVARLREQAIREE
jgi:hypothetical protein